MLTLPLLGLFHVLTWCAGAVLFRRAWPGSPRRSWTTPAPYAAYLAGLVVNTVVAFVANQFLGLRVGLPILCGIALGQLLVWSLCLKRVRPDEAPPALPSTGTPDRLHTLLACIAVTVFLTRHLDMLWQPLNDWDTFLYHLRFGQLFAEGQFPSDIGPSYNLQTAAAYPPLFYVVYGLNAHLTFSGATFLLPKVTVIVLDALIGHATYLLARRRLGLTPAWAMLAVLAAMLVVNPTPNTQSLTMLCVLLAAYYALGAHRGKGGDGHRWLVAAVCWVGCYWANYLGLVVMVLFLAGLGIDTLWSRYRGAGRAPSLSTWLVTIAVIAVGIAPHLVRNAWFAGNPLYPALLDTIGGVGVTDWWLENRSISQRLDVGIADIPGIFGRALPLSTVVVAAWIAALAPGPMPRSPRIAAALAFGGFLVPWIFVLQISHTPTSRYLYPIVPLGLCAIASLLQGAWRRGALGSTLAVSLIIGLAGWAVAATALGAEHVAVVTAFWSLLVVAAIVLGGVALFREVRSTEVGRLGRVLALLGAISLVYVSSWPDVVGANALRLALGLALGGAAVGIDAAWRRLSRARRGATSRQRVAPAVPVVVLAAALAAAVIRQPDHRGATQFVLPIYPDLAWMNTQLPEDSVILTLEDRLFMLELPFVPGDHWTLEPFYRETTVEGSLAALAPFGVTHIYVTEFFLSFRPFTDKLDLLLGTPHPEARVVYSSDTGFVVALGPPDGSPPADATDGAREVRTSRGAP